tara:strand:- start:753 stop:1196 length:444 start_codon:yes stop_codon:yes gene_type:complete
MQKIVLSILFFFIFQSLSFSKENDYFLMLKNSKVNVRYGPSLEYPIKFVYKKKFLPIKVIDKKENFRRIIDHKKNSGWIHIALLKKSNSLIVLEDKIIFKRNTNFSKPIVKIEKGRLVFIEKCISEWCKIKTDKYNGWINIDNVWGI